ncbi:conserved hypothetical protein, partial [Ixodes scapularis]
MRASVRVPALVSGSARVCTGALLESSMFPCVPRPCVALCVRPCPRVCAGAPAVCPGTTMCAAYTRVCPTPACTCVGSCMPMCSHMRPPAPVYIHMCPSPALPVCAHVCTCEWPSAHECTGLCGGARCT